MSNVAGEDAGKENVFEDVIEFTKQVDELRNYFFLQTRSEKGKVLKEQADLIIKDLDAIPEEMRQSKEDQAMYLYLRGKLLDVSPGYNQDAEQHLTDALNLKNDMVDAWICLGACMWKKGDLVKAESCYKFGLDLDPNNKELLRHLSALERRVCRGDTGETDVRKLEEIIKESIKHAKDAIGQDVHDGLSWYFLGNACLTAYFLTGSWDHDMLLQSLKAYKNAAKDKRMQCTAELCYNCSMKMNDAKRMPPPKSPLPTVDSLASSLASVELDPSYERATVDRLTEGLNKGKAVTGKVLFLVENRSKKPLYYIVCDSDRNCFVITVYGVRNTAIKEEDQVTLLDPYFHYFDFEWKGKQYQFKSVRANLLRKLRVNGAIVSPEHVIHRSMYAEFMEG
ncbi:hypothetical protein RND71_023992 [Anisodus tanguticus]|uniref:Tetratricopeptide repeat protein 5 OB fold domain-containing protein n=1 Tax=Anisodus tanguticus TaxID=243964 RepID=A0AAE1RWJ1_9SOLA|nr:hypothetical protein RND71_023992 [Anisodus tanguticus]